MHFVNVPAQFDALGISKKKKEKKKGSSNKSKYFIWLTGLHI